MKKYNIFLSYDELDLALVERIMSILERMGISAYSFKHYPEYGEYIPEIVRKNIADSEYFVVLLTQAGIESQWVNQEIGMAFALRMLIIPIVQTSVESKGFVELRQRIDYEPYKPETAISCLIYRLRSLFSVTSIRFQCKNETCRNQFVSSVPSQLEINEAVKNNVDFIATCPLCKSEVRYSPLTFEQTDNTY